MSKASICDESLGALTDDQLTPEVRVWQRRKGHRFSSDDVATASVAWHARPDAKRYLELGCGLGSVLLLLAWKCPSLVCAGIEAQASSFELLRRNVLRSGYAERVSIRQGDLRDGAMLDALGTGFDLVTGTPPYFPPGTALDANDQQRTFARMELRGGVEVYLEAAARVVHAEGTVVMCGDSRANPRVMAAAKMLGLVVVARTEVIPKVGKPSLFSVWTLVCGQRSAPVEVATLTLRERDGRPAEGARWLREFSGFAPLATLEKRQCPVSGPVDR